MSKTQHWYYGTGDDRKVVAAATKKEAASKLGVSQYALDRNGGVLEDGSPAPVPTPTPPTPPKDDGTLPPAPPVEPPTPPTPRPARSGKGRTTSSTSPTGGPPKPIVTTQAEVDKLPEDWDGVINLEVWNGFKNGEAVRFDGAPKGKFTFLRYYKSGTREYVEIMGRSGVRPVKPDAVHKIEPAKTTKTKRSASPKLSAGATLTSPPTGGLKELLP